MSFLKLIRAGKRKRMINIALDEWAKIVGAPRGLTSEEIIAYVANLKKENISIDHRRKGEIESPAQ